jgi:hypothetical protein
MAVRVVTAEEMNERFVKYAETAEAGKRLALQDIASGNLRFIWWPGHPPSFADWFPEYHRLLKERLGVDAFQQIPIDASGEAVDIFVQSHYRAMEAELESRDGVGILHRLREEAKTAHRRALPKRDPLSS